MNMGATLSVRQCLTIDDICNSLEWEDKECDGSRNPIGGQSATKIGNKSK